ncbi:MAG: DNA topoisomerase IV subunit A [Phycisphaerae bacterium]|jgi:DNA topoisomerase-6 subunit A|nr:DNA topoisomerase IV subunit A [Phycisphaerae bacterium]MCZ2401104.1 DNA topoisomerase IV subunit A [Phycisphaerae bacterium]NUQ49513.1 DNA topoisomerase IV subunit A [Phycisphaerae bacterium]
MPRKAATKPVRRDRAAAAERIRKLAAGVIATVSQGEDPHVDIPSRTLGNVRFNEKKGIIELLEGKQRRYFFSLLGRRGGEGSQAKKFMQTLRVAEACKHLIDTDNSTSLRDLFYMLKRPVIGSKELIFYEQEESDPVIEDIEVSVNALREELGVHAKAAGAMVAPMTIEDNGDTINLASMGSGGWAVPSIVEADVIRFVRSSAKFVLLVEKDAMWQRFNKDRFWEQHQCALIHGGGQPPRGVRRLIYRMHHELKLPVYVLVDNDPWGYYIYSVVKQGSINLAYESQRMAVPAARFVGLSSYDAEQFDIPPHVPLPLTDEDRRRAREIREYPWFQSKGWQREIKHMESLGVKLELEALSSKGLSFSTQEYLPRKLRDKKWLD